MLSHENPVESKGGVCLINCNMFRTLYNHHAMLLEGIFTILKLRNFYNYFLKVHQVTVPYPDCCRYQAQKYFC